MTKVKICGLLQVEHVKAAVDAGADAIGFLFAPSSRQVTIQKAKELAQAIPERILKIGVFVDASRDEIEQAYKEVPLDYIQFHGNESPEFIKKIGLPSIKALSVHSVEDVRKAASFDVDYLLFDTPGEEFKGGSGKTFDWRLLSDAGIPASKLILAGGLNVDNVGEAIRRVQPYMVDVSSGVEKNSKKDEKLIHKFIRAAKDEER